MEPERARWRGEVNEMAEKKVTPRAATGKTAKSPAKAATRVTKQTKQTKQTKRTHRKK